MNMQDVLDHSIERAGPYLRASFQMPAHSLDAVQLNRHLSGRLWTIALATVTAKGEPRVAPVGSLFVDGRFSVPILKSAARVKQLQRNPAVSASLFDEKDFAVIVHGRGRVIGVDDADFDGVVTTHREIDEGRSVLDWGPAEQAAYIIVDPERMYTFARYPDRF